MLLDWVCACIESLRSSVNLRRSRGLGLCASERGWVCAARTRGSVKARSLPAHAGR